MDNRINDKDLAFVTGGLGEDHITEAKRYLEFAANSCTDEIPSDIQKRIASCIRQLETCNDDFTKLGIESWINVTIGMLENFKSTVVLSDELLALIDNIKYQLSLARNELRL